MTSAKRQTKTHIVIPDTQTKAGVPLAHMDWIGQFIRDEYDGADLTVIHLGDHWDMPSLSSYDKGKGSMEGRRYVKDIDTGNEAFHRLSDPFADVLCDRHFLTGNHENRIARAAENDVQMEGLVTLDDLDTCDWNVHDFLDPVTLDGVTYAHYFYNPMTGRPFGGQSVDTRIKTIGYTFVMGHQPGLQRGMRSLTNGQRIHGIIAGSCYLHDEEYLGPQGNHAWQGIVVLHQVERGNFDVMEVSLDYLCRRFENKRLSQFLWRH